MKRLHCHCGNTVYFENSRCLSCRRELGFLPDWVAMGAIEPGGGDAWKAYRWRARGGNYRKCRNYWEHDVCNWMIPGSDPEEYCVSCRLNQIIPSLENPRNKLLWFWIEQAKRRLIYSILNIGLPLVGRREDPERGLAFRFLEDTQPPAEFSDELANHQRVMTGHRDGVITVNIREADPSHREETRQQMGEQYRTLLGHFRHEIGHYYWDRLIRNTEWLEDFRETFGDEREDYDAALARYYSRGPRPDWRERFVSRYGAAHPWEDWGETWAHYFHMIQTLETAHAYGFSLKGRRLPRPRTVLRDGSPAQAEQVQGFDVLLFEWGELTLAMNALNRSMGMLDPYPFALSETAKGKLRYVHGLIRRTVQTSEAHP